MAGLATDVWEFRATAGNANAGGGFDTVSGGTDYSNQDAAQLQLTDLATSGIGVTTLTSVTGGFTAAMVGNYIQIRSGTNVTAGFYRVTVRTDTNTVTLDRNPDDGVGGISGGSGDLGGALDILTDSFLDDVDVVVAGNTIHIKKDGVMTLTGAVVAAKDGTLTDKIIIEGYNTSRGDNPTGSNRPTIAAAGNNWIFDNFWTNKDLILTTTTSTGIRGDTGSQFENLKITNSSGTGGRTALSAVVSEAKVLRCELISTNGVALEASGADQRIISNYLHDSVTGIDFQTGGGGQTLCGNIIDTCTTGINATSTDDSLLFGNTFYNCTTAVSETDGDAWTIINNIFDACTDGLKWTTKQATNFSDFNVYDNTTDATLFDLGDNDIIGDPGLTDPANGDFTLGSGSNALSAGMQVGASTGAVGDYKVNIGVDQDDVVAGGGGLLTHPGMAGGMRG